MPDTIATLFECTVPGKPVPQARPRVTRGGHTYYPKRSTEARKLLVRHFLGAMQGNPLVLDCAMRLNVTVGPIRANSDLDNHLKMILDALVEAEVIKDDAVRYIREVEIVATEGEPQTVVALRRLEFTVGK